MPAPRITVAGISGIGDLETGGYMYSRHGIEKAERIEVAAKKLSL